MFRLSRGGVEDRWHEPDRPGAYEWWGFEAIDVERSLAFSLRISVGDPMDPVYAGVLARGGAGADPRHHVLVRAVLYRHGRRLLARDVRPGAGTFSASPVSGAVSAGPARVIVEEAPDGRRWRVDLEPGTRLEFSGPPGLPAGRGPLREPVWDLAGLNLEVRGQVRVAGGVGDVEFSGRGIHDHGYGPASPGALVRSWAWGWAHAWEYGVAWRQVVLQSGAVDTLLLVDRGGDSLQAESARSRPFRRRVSLLGIPYRRRWRLDGESGAGLAVEQQSVLGSSPVGVRMLTNIRLTLEDPEPRLRLMDGVGLASVARPQRAKVPALRWLARAREGWTARRAGSSG